MMKSVCFCGQLMLPSSRDNRDSRSLTGPAVRLQRQSFPAKAILQTWLISIIELTILDVIHDAPGAMGIGVPRGNDHGHGIRRQAGQHAGELQWGLAPQ